MQFALSFVQKAVAARQRSIESSSLNRSVPVLVADLLCLNGVTKPIDVNVQALIEFLQSQKGRLYEAYVLARDEWSAYCDKLHRNEAVWNEFFRYIEGERDRMQSGAFSLCIFYKHITLDNIVHNKAWNMATLNPVPDNLFHPTFIVSIDQELRRRMSGGFVQPTIDSTRQQDSQIAGKLQRAFKELDDQNSALMAHLADSRAEIESVRASCLREYESQAGVWSDAKAELVQLATDMPRFVDHNKVIVDLFVAWLREMRASDPRTCIAKFGAQMLADAETADQKKQRMEQQEWKHAYRAARSEYFMWEFHTRARRIASRCLESTAAADSAPSMSVREEIRTAASDDLPHVQSDLAPLDSTVNRLIEEKRMLYVLYDLRVLKEAMMKKLEEVISAHTTGQDETRITDSITAQLDRSISVLAATPVLTDDFMAFCLHNQRNEANAWKAMSLLRLELTDCEEGDAIRTYPDLFDDFISVFKVRAGTDVHAQCDRELSLITSNPLRITNPCVDASWLVPSALWDCLTKHCRQQAHCDLNGYAKQWQIEMEALLIGKRSLANALTVCLNLYAIQLTREM